MDCPVPGGAIWSFETIQSKYTATNFPMLSEFGCSIVLRDSMEDCVECLGKGWNLHL